MGASSDKTVTVEIRAKVYDLLAKNLTGMADAVKKGEQVFARLEQASAAASKVLRKAGQDAKAAGEGVRSAAKGMEDAGKAADTASAKAKKMSGAFKSLKSFFQGGFRSKISVEDDATPKTGKAKRSLRDFAGRAWRTTLSVADKATSGVKKAVGAAKSFAGKVWRGTISIIDKATAPIRKIKDALSRLKSFITKFINGETLKKAIWDPMTQYDTTIKAGRVFNTFLGSQDKSNKLMADIEKFDVDTPLNTTDVIGYTRQMLTARWPEDTVLEDLRRIGDMSAAYGLEDSALADIVKAFASIREKDRLAVDDMTQKLDEKVPAWALLTEGLGYEVNGDTIAKVKKMAENKEIGGEEGIAAMMKAMSKFDGEMEWISDHTVSGLKSKIEDTFQVKILKKWGAGLSSSVIPTLQRAFDWLDKNEEKISGWGDALGKIGEELSGWALDKLTAAAGKIDEVFNSDEFKNADFQGKVKFAWDELIAKPFSAWWDSTGRAKITEMMSDFGEGIGKGLSIGIMAILGFDVSGMLDDGVSIGASFGSGFLKGFNSAGVWEAVKAAGGKIFTKASRALPGGEKPSASDYAAAGLVGYGAYKTGKAVFGAGKAVKTVGGWIGKAGKALYKIKPIENAVDTVRLMGMYGKDAVVQGVKSLGKTLAPYAATAGGAASLIGGVAWAAYDAYEGVQKAKEWLGNDTTGDKVAAGIGGALGGAGPGVGQEGSTGDKAKNILAGAAKGSLIGAGIGTLIAPGLGTAIGGGIGAVVGAIGSAAGGSRIAKGLKTAGGWLKDKFDNGFGPSKEVLEEIAEKNQLFPKKSELSDKTSLNESIGAFITETIPKKMDGLWTSAAAFFTENAAGAASAIGGTIKTFVSETVPGLISGALESAGSLVFDENVSTGVFKQSWKGANADRKASGGFVGQKTLSWLAEEGTPEMVIPLGVQRRGRGIALWKQAGEMMGVTADNHAKGALSVNQSAYSISGGLSEKSPLTPSSTRTAGNPVIALQGVGPSQNHEPAISRAETGSVNAPKEVNVNIGEISFRVEAAGGSALDGFRNQKKAITEEIMKVVTDAVANAFVNMPLAGA